MSNKMNDRIWRISELIKLVAVEDITAISITATELKKRGQTLEELDLLDPQWIYQVYCSNCGGDVEC